MNPDAFDEPTRNRGFDWHEAYHSIRDRFWIVALCLVLGGVAAFGYLRGQESLFQARAVLVLQESQGNILGRVAESVTQDRVQSLDMINTTIDRMGSFLFAKRVAESLDLGSNPSFLQATDSGDESIPPEAAAGRLGGFISISYRRNTRLIDITAQSRDAKLSTDIANAYVTEFIRLGLERSSEATRSAGEFLVDEAARLAKKMRISEEAMQSFRERERATSLETMLSDAQARAGATTENLRETRTLIAQIEADLAASANLEDNATLLIKLPSVASDPRVAEILSTIAILEQNLGVLSQRYRPEHPAYVDLSSRLASAQGELADTLASIVTRLGTQRDNLVELAASQEQSLSGSQDRLLEVTGKYVEYNSLTRDLETDRALYDAVLARLKEVDLTKGIANEPFSIQELAQGAGPIPIPWTKTMIMGILGGLAAGVGITLLLAKLDPSIHTVDQAEALTGLRVITAVPQIKNAKPGLLVDEDRHGVVAEAFRTLRASVALLGEAENRRVFLFTSAMPSEGKTFSSANFAATLAQQGFRTLYIDGDLRKPAVSKLLFGEHRKPGFTEVLLGKCPLAEAAIPSGVENLDVITAGGRSENPAELLATSKVETILDEARASYDRVVIDSAPVIAVSDSLLLAEFADINCLILRANQTSRKSVQHAIRLLNDLGHPPAGLVLNGLHEGRGGYYSYYAYSGRNYGDYGARGVYGRTS